MYGNYKILITDFRGNLLHTIEDNDFVSLDILDVLNDSGSFKIKSRSKERCPFKSATAVIVFRNDIQIYNGYVTKIVEEYDMASRSWIWEANGENHIGLLKRRYIYPRKGPDDNYHKFIERSRAFPISSAPSIINALITENVINEIPHAYPVFIVEGSNIESTAQPPVLSKWYRFENLYDVVSELANGYGITVHAVTNPETNKVTYYTRYISDKSDHIVFSLENKDITHIRRVNVAPEIHLCVTSYNSDYGNPPLWQYAAVGYVNNDDIDWYDLGREAFYEPKEDDFQSSEHRYYRLVDIANEYAQEEYTETDGIEIELDLLNVRYTYGYDMDRVEPGSTDVDSFINDFQLGNIVTVDFLGETVQRMITQMRISVKYGEESIVPTIGGAINGSFTELIKTLNRTSTDINKSKNKETRSS